MSERVREGIKTAVIALLLVSAFVHAYFATVERTQLYSGTSDTAEETVSVIEFAAPVAISARASDGTLTAARYSGREVTRAFSRTLASAAEAIGSAARLTACTREDFIAAQESACIVYEYLRPVDVRVLAAFFELDAEKLGTTAVKRLIIAPKHLYIYTGDAYFTAETVTDSSVFDILPDMGASAASLASELPALDAVETHGGVIFTGAAEHPVLTAESPMVYRAMRDELMTSLGAGMFINSCFSESDGVFVYIAADFTLRVETSGSIYYKRTAEAPDAEKSFRDSVDAAVSMCRRLVMPYNGEASLIFTGAEERGGDYVFYFDRMLAGGVITDPGDSHAAEITVRNGVVTELRAQLISLTQTGESAELMSETMACAASDGEFTLAFVPSGGRYIPCWLES